MRLTAFLLNYLKTSSCNKCGNNLLEAAFYITVGSARGNKFVTVIWQLNVIFLTFIAERFT